MKPLKFKQILNSIYTGSLFLSTCFTLSCRQDMHDQPKYKPLQKSTFFGDYRASRPLIEGTIAQGKLKIDEHFHTGKKGGKFLNTLPFPTTEKMLIRGQSKYDIFCSPCHDRAGTGKGIIVQKGFPPPPSLHTQRLRETSVGYFFDVITNGYATMYSYSTRISPSDRWAIAAYVRTLQFSQHARINELPEQDQQKLRKIEE